jgi:hypothetical protein
MSFRFSLAVAATIAALDSGWPERARQRSRCGNFLPTLFKATEYSLSESLRVGDGCPDAVAYSKPFKGGAIYAGLPYYYARNDPRTVSTCSLAIPAIDPTALVKVTKSWAQQGPIDPVQNLQGQPVYLWSGLVDTSGSGRCSGCRRPLR